MASHENSERGSGVLRVRWSAIALAFALLAVGGLGTLVVVVSVKDVDTLSTLALALAVVAFSAQLIVSLTQAQGSAQQVAQTERINSETRSTLVEVRATSQAVLANQAQQFDKVLSVALRGAAETVVHEVAGAVNGASGEDSAGSLDVEVIVDNLERRLRDSLYPAIAPPFSGGHRLVGAFGRPIGSDSEAGHALEVLRSLDAEELVILMSRAASTKAVNLGALPSITTRRPNSGTMRLLEMGIYESAAGSDGLEKFRPTARAQIVLRLLCNSHSGKSWYNALVGSSVANGSEL